MTYLLSTETKGSFDSTRARTVVKTENDRAIPEANKRRSTTTIGINAIQNSGVVEKYHIQTAPPTEWAAKVAPRLLMKSRFLKK